MKFLPFNFLILFILVSPMPCFGKTPLFGGFEYNYVSPAEFKESDHDDEHLQFQESLAKFGSLVYYNPLCEEGLALGIEYKWTYLKWNDNPSFDQRNFHTIGFTLAGFSTRLYDWNWKAYVTMWMDAEHLDDWNHYTAWDLLLWGRYQYTRRLGLHLGFYAITGMKIDRVYPLLGFDWNCWRKLKLSVVFPVDISALWVFNDKWTVGTAVRFFESRHRTGRDEEEPRALWEYQSWGVELGLTYHCTDYIHANIHIGENLGGKLKIADRDYDDRHHFKFKSAPYIGTELSLHY